MHQAVRTAVFETNSSSTHSLTIAGEDLLDPLPVEVLRSGTMVVRPRKFGWEWHRYYSTENKMAYLLSQIDAAFLGARGSDADCAVDLRAHSSAAEAIIGLVERHAGIRVEVRPESSVGIDPMSAGVGMDMIRSERLLPFLLSRTDCIQTGNDGWGPYLRIDNDRGENELFDPAVHCIEIGDPAFERFVLTLDPPAGEMLLDLPGGAKRAAFDMALLDSICIELDRSICTGMRFLTGNGHALQEDGFANAHELLIDLRASGSDVRLLIDAPVDVYGSLDRPDWTKCRTEMDMVAPADAVSGIESIVDAAGH